MSILIEIRFLFRYRNSKLCKNDFPSAGNILVGLCLMNRFLLVAGLIVLLIPGYLFGQGLNPGSFITGMPSPQTIGQTTPIEGFFSGLQGLTGFKIGKVLLNPFVQLGYQWNGVNLDVPINTEFDPLPADPNSHLVLGTMDVVLHDYNFWMGTLGLNAIMSPTLTVFGSAIGLLPRSFTQIGQLPISIGQVGFNPNITMTGTNFESWTIQCGVSVGIGAGYSVLAGSLWQYTSMAYEDARNALRQLNPTLRQDFLLKNWAPFIGFQFLQEGNYRAALIYSPLLTSSGAINIRTTSPTMSDLSYNLNQPGYLLSAVGEYFLPLPPPTTFSAWFNGSISSIKGSTDVSFVAGAVSRSGVASNLSLNQYSLSGGISAGLIF